MNPEQRPTSETDALHAKQGLTHASYRDFARNLERQRDEARESLEATQQELNKEIRQRQEKDKQLEAMRFSLMGAQQGAEEARKIIRKRGEELEAMREAIKEAYDALTEANDRSKPENNNGASLFHVHHKSKKALAKLQPFIKP